MKRLLTNLSMIGILIACNPDNNDTSKSEYPSEFELSLIWNDYIDYKITFLDENKFRIYSTDESQVFSGTWIGSINKPGDTVYLNSVLFPWDNTVHITSKLVYFDGIMLETDQNIKIDTFRTTIR